MLSVGHGTSVVLATEPVDPRRGDDGPVTLVRERWRADPYSGELFVFFGRRIDRVKILFFNAGRSVAHYEHLERGALHDVTCPRRRVAFRATRRIEGRCP